ncbi:MAG: hypothetical protein KZQ83_19665 [gamma proteobacterium symbiont of Taylorina sp.]|nr:hypothetical protein [gamma proteobacterium symbiont of Taylorina sp.]
MIAFFNNAVVIGFAGLIADYIRKRYQQHKQAQEKQDELLNDLSYHMANVIGETSVLIMELSNCLTGGKVDFEMLDSHKVAWNESIMEWNNSNAVYYYKIQKLTAKPHSAAKLFRDTDFSEEILIVGKKVKIEEKTTLVSAVWILSKMILRVLPSYEAILHELQILLEKKGNPELIEATIQVLDNMEDNIKPSSQSYTIEEIKKILLDQDNERNDLEDWLFNKSTKLLSSCYRDLLIDTKGSSKPFLPDSDDEKLVYNVLWLLDRYKEMFGLFAQVDKKIQEFIPVLHKEFQKAKY